MDFFQKRITNLFPIGIYFLLFFPLFSNEKTNSEPSPNHPNYEQKELKYEEGEVTVDLRLAAENLKRKVEKNYSLITKILKNRNKEEDLIRIRTKIAQGNTEYLRRNYKLARRIYKDAVQDIESIAKELSQDYRNYFLNYTEALNQEILYWKEKRMESPPNPFLIPYLEKKGSESGDYYKFAEWLSQSQGNLQALAYYRLSIASLIEGITRSRQEKEPKTIPEDHLSEDERKLYDESRNLLYEEENRKREEFRKWLQERKANNEASEENTQTLKSKNENPNP